MKKFSIICAALTLALPATAYAAADCCKDMACCKDGADCCKDMKKGGEHADHDMPAAPAR
ncbi:hypothetical protein [Sphingomonas japonica]|uniref:Uncharacterized protein n=1 Tax=Sphingomonas japonica TaxID=511662 RepID=A0ABX0TW12_9SPHN|nr:hypothetical protein [Sphingomonas japonica]NIJ22508.1 hypothetical protein [Sphingomonas japonica]